MSSNNSSGVSSDGVEVKVEEEETLGQLRDRQVLAFARAAVPGPRAAFVHIKVEDSSSGEDTDGEEVTGGEGDGGGEEEEEEEDEDEEEEEEGEVEPRDLRVHGPGASSKGVNEAVTPQILPPGARSEPGYPRARLRAPGRVADKAVKDNDVQLQLEEEEAGMVPELAMRGDGDRASSSQFKGVSWDKERNKWRAQCKGKFLGLHTTEEDAARAYSKYLKDGSVPREASISQFTGVSWNKIKNSWRARCKGIHLGHHTTEEAAARAYSKYLEDGIVPGHAASTSQFTGVSWDKTKNGWMAQCMVKKLGRHATEEAAARAYNVEAARVGRPLNVIPPAGAAGVGAGAGAGGIAGLKRTAPKTLKCDERRLYECCKRVPLKRVALLAETDGGEPGAMESYCVDVFGTAYVVTMCCGRIATFDSLRCTKTSALMCERCVKASEIASLAGPMTRVCHFCEQPVVRKKGCFTGRFVNADDNSQLLTFCKRHTRYFMKRENEPMNLREVMEAIPRR